MRKRRRQQQRNQKQQPEKRETKLSCFSVSYLSFLQVKDWVEHRIWSFGKKNLFDYIQIVMQWVGGDMWKWGVGTRERFPV